MTRFLFSNRVVISIVSITRVGDHSNIPWYKANNSRCDKNNAWEKINILLVAENKKITSIITEKDLKLFLLKDKSDRTLQQISLNEVAKPIMIIFQFKRI